MFTQTKTTITSKTNPFHPTIPPAIHVAGILLLVAVTVLCGPLSAVFP